MAIDRIRIFNWVLFTLSISGRINNKFASWLSRVPSFGWDPVRIALRLLTPMKRKTKSFMNWAEFLYLNLNMRIAEKVVDKGNSSSIEHITEIDIIGYAMNYHWTIRVLGDVSDNFLYLAQTRIAEVTFSHKLKIEWLTCGTIGLPSIETERNTNSWTRIAKKLKNLKSILVEVETVNDTIVSVRFDFVLVFPPFIIIKTRKRLSRRKNARMACNDLRLFCAYGISIMKL